MPLWQGHTPELRARVRSCAARLRDGFEAAGAVPVECPILLPAATLLDLYGEDIRARAYVTSDALRGEQMMRPDFTVPVVEMHMADGAEPARYTYSGEVFRRQEEDEARANEYLQVGVEIFDGSNPAAADAEVFALTRKAVEGLNLRAATGDIGILMAAVNGLNTSAPRKAALLRHIWRPRRFRALLDRYAGRAPVPAARAALQGELGDGADLGVALGPGEADRADVAVTRVPPHADAAGSERLVGQAGLLGDVDGVRRRRRTGRGREHGGGRRGQGEEGALHGSLRGRWAPGAGAGERG